MKQICVLDYDRDWPQRFEAIKARIWPALEELSISIEHIGSTAVPGLAAKPVIDISVVVESTQLVGVAVHRLENLGYLHRGQLGVAGRESFKSPDGPIKHHLYVCLDGSVGILNHIAVRNHLRSNPAAASEYATLKRELAVRYPFEMDHYIDGKTGFLLRVLGEAGLSRSQLESVEQSNRLPE